MLLVAVGAATFGGCDSGPPTGANDGDALPLRPRFAIDGDANLDALPISLDREVPWEEREGLRTGRTRMRIATLNDDRDLYLVVQWDDASFDDAFDTDGAHASDGVRLQFDSDGDGSVGPGDDAQIVWAAHGGALYYDGVVASVAGTPGAFGDVRQDRVGDGMGRLAFDAASGRYTAEFLIPFVGDAVGEDGVLAATTRYAISAYDGSTGSYAHAMGATFATESTDAWPTLALVTAGEVVRPAFPSDLSGLIVLLSEHEGTRRVYLFRPRSQELSPVSLDPDLHIARLALSHDRNWILLEASYTPNDRNSYEIFRVASDGTRLAQLTDNHVYDGGPAWSPSDARIAYTSERDTDNSGRTVGSIILMTADGVELDDLSNRAVDERDPSYLSDGRIVFKTTRASPWPRYRIAAVHETGVSFGILTEALGGTDHHPMGRGSWIYYERFREERDYTSDPGARLKPWDIMSVHAGGGQGGTLVSDGWANRAPVPDPTGAYVAYLRQSAHSYLELVTESGTFLGRLLPGVTDVVQFDWQ